MDITLQLRNSIGSRKLEHSNRSMFSPSVNSGTLENGFQVNGASSAENQFNIDGISTNSIITGSSRVRMLSSKFSRKSRSRPAVLMRNMAARWAVSLVPLPSRAGIHSMEMSTTILSGSSLLVWDPSSGYFLDPIDDRTVSLIQQDYKNPFQRTTKPDIRSAGTFIKNKLFFFSAASPRFATWPKGPIWRIVGRTPDKDRTRPDLLAGI